MVISTSLVVVNGTQSALLVRGMTDENRRSLKYFVSTEATDKHSMCIIFL